MLLIPVYTRIDLIKPNATFKYNKKVYIKCMGEFYLAYNGNDLKYWNEHIKSKFLQRTTL